MTGNNGEDSHKKNVATYDYCDENGKLLFQVVRYEPKTFRQRVPASDGGWSWKLEGARRVLYKLPELIENDAPVYLVEGEKDVHTLMGHGLVATCNPGGAGKWRQEYNDHLKDREVIILPDNDQAGRDHSKKVAQSLQSIASSIKVVKLQGLPEKGDVSDFLKNRSKEDFLKIIDATPFYVPMKETGQEPPKKEDKPRSNQATQIVELAENKGLEVFHDPEDSCFATFPVKDHVETWPVDSKAFQKWLTKNFYESYGKAPSKQAIEEAISTLGARGQFEGQQIPVHIRTAIQGEHIFIDLCNAGWEVVKVSANGWEVMNQSSVKFTRTRSMDQLPIPLDGGSIDELWEFVNIPVGNDRTLTTAFMVSSLLPNGPYPLLNLEGLQGCGKSTASRYIRSLIDPSNAPLRSLPQTEQNMMISAKNSRILCFDNISHVPPWLSDALCRIATGGGFSTRTLYTNNEETIIDVQRPVILNGIAEISTREDLLDRCLVLQLPRMDSANRKSEAEMNLKFVETRPKIFGALLTTLSKVLKILPNVRLEESPRMADFARVGVACERALGWEKDSFLRAYEENRQAAINVAIEGSLVARGVLKLMGRSETWEGTTSELHTELKQVLCEDEVRQKHFPKQPNGLSKQLKRCTPSLLESGVEVEFLGPQGKTRQKTISIKRMPEKDRSHRSTAHKSNNPLNNNEITVNDEVNGKQGVNDQDRSLAQGSFADNSFKNNEVSGENDKNGVVRNFSNEQEEWKVTI